MKKDLIQNEYYTILSSYSETQLSNKVNEMMKQGWVPQGGIAIEGINFYQPMVKLSRESNGG